VEALATTAAILACLGLFCVFVARRGDTALEWSVTAAHPPRTGSLPSILIDFGYWLFTPVVRLLGRVKITPNVVTAVSLPASTLAALAFGSGRFALGGWLLLFAWSLDAWDGMLARQTGTASASGEFVDAAADRYNDLVVMIGFLYYYAGNLVPSLIVGAALIGTTLVSYTRAKGEALGVDPDLGWMQRQERGLYLGTAAILAPLYTARLFDLVILALGLIAIGANVTTVMRARYVLRRLQLAGDRRSAPVERSFRP
jgi:CDP-diacylglycerol--glycerol-3-phosphate 3-phosphatidyltransferase